MKSKFHSRWSALDSPKIWSEEMSLTSIAELAADLNLDTVKKVIDLP